MTDVAFIADFLEFDKLLIRIGNDYYCEWQYYIKQELIDKINQQPDYTVRNKALQDLELIDESKYTDFIDVHAYRNEALSLAAEYGHLDVVKCLVEQGANIHDCNDCALRLAAEKGHLNVVQYLVEQGADIHALDNYALRCAAENGHIEVVKYLVE